MISLRKVIAVGISVAILLAGSIMNVAKAAPKEEPLNLYAQSAVLMDAASGRILYEKNGRQMKPMASTTKIMTCILALEYGNLEDYVKVSSYAAGMPKVKLGMQAGEYYKLQDLLYSLMLESHNDSAVAIAEHIGGSVEEFADRMNQKAAELGCSDTFFITPNGLDATITTKEGAVKTHATTAADLAKIMAYCIMDSPKKEEFLAITRKPSYQLCAFREKEGDFAENGRTFSCTNHNAFLGMMEGALSGKTGFTGNAGYCYVGALRRDERTYIVALLACGWPNHKTYKWSDTQKLMEYGLSEFVYHTFESVRIKPEALNGLTVQNGQTKELGEQVVLQPSIVPLDEQNAVKGVLLKKDEKIEVVCKQETQLAAPVKAGMRVGEIAYLVDGVRYLTDEIVVTRDVKAIDYSWCMMQVIRNYLTKVG